MINTRINKVSAEGENIFIFQYIDAEGNQTEKKKSLQQFLHPFIKSYQEQIDLLKNTLEDKQKIEGLLDKAVLELSDKITILEKERDSQEKQIRHFIKEIEGKDLSKTTDLYQEAFNHFVNGDMDMALTVLDEAKMEEEEQLAIESIKQKSGDQNIKSSNFKSKT